MNVNSSSNRGEAILAALKTQFPGAVLDVLIHEKYEKYREDIGLFGI